MGRIKVIATYAIVCAIAWALTLPQPVPFAEPQPDIVIDEQGAEPEGCGADYGLNLESVPGLKQAFLDGPTQTIWDRYDQTIQSNWKNFRGALNSGKTYGLDAAELQSSSSLTREKYIQIEHDKLAFGYRSAAIAGLGAINNEESRGILTEWAHDPTHAAFHGSIDLALTNPEKPFGYSMEKKKLPHR